MPFFPGAKLGPYEIVAAIGAGGMGEAYRALHDIARDGRVLLSHENWRRQLLGFFPGDKNEHPYSWLDYSNPTALSADRRVMSFTEGGRGLLH